MAASEGQRLFSCAAADGAAELRAAVTAVLEGGGERTVRLVGQDRFLAGRRPVAAELVPETDASGAVVSVLGAFVDGGQAPAGDTALERELMRLRLALKGSTDGWWDWDLATLSHVPTSSLGAKCLKSALCRHPRSAGNCRRYHRCLTIFANAMRFRTIRSMV